MRLRCDHCSVVALSYGKRCRRTDDRDRQCKYQFVIGPEKVSCCLSLRMHLILLFQVVTVGSLSTQFPPMDNLQIEYGICREREREAGVMNVAIPSPPIC